MDSTAQSLEARLQNLTDPTEKIDTLNELAWIIHMEKPQKGFSYAEEALNLASSGDFGDNLYIAGVVGSLRTLAALHNDTGKYDLALSQSMKALEHLDGIQNPDPSLNRLKVHVIANIS